ncbi:hypothetical protein GCM10023080_031050 [Streptomyces pseudoechinosporeus]
MLQVLEASDTSAEISEFVVDLVRPDREGARLEPSCLRGRYLPAWANVAAGELCRHHSGTA